jgi:HAE1 family hydrophobic/amphiphilic exporter-1
MDIIRFSIRNPVTVIVGVILIALFGLIALQEIPIQLSPNVERPIITVSTIWPGSTPYEIERDVVEEQEKVLKGIPNLYEMESDSTNGRSEITLRFDIGTDIDNALLRVSNKLAEVPEYPENVDKPILNASGAQSSPVMWIVMKTRDGNPRDPYSYRTYIENDVRQFLERVDGVSDLFIGGGIESEMHVKVSPEKLAAYGLTIDTVVNALRNENANISAGNLQVGRRDYRVRTVAEYRSTTDIENVIVLSDGQRDVKVGDLATVEFGFQKLETPMISNGKRGISIGVRPEPNANVLELTDNIEVVINQLNEGKLKNEDVYLDLVNEQRPYIRGAIALLKQNILVGGVLAVLVLLIFLRSITPTIVVSTSIPISIVGTFILMRAAGSTLNVVSLAGIAFAVGMLVDNAIVVLENIDRHRKMGKAPADAAYDGAREVWGAVLASSLTTVAVFLPVVFLEDEAGQLFRDIAIAVSCAVTLSLIVSVTVIPMFSKQLYELRMRRGKNGVTAVAARTLSRLGEKGNAVFMGFLGLIMRNPVTRLATIVFLAAGAAVTAYLMIPKMEYLPQGNRDLIINVLIPPPGLSFEERQKIGQDLFAFFEPYYEPGYEGYPGIRNGFYVGRQQALILGIVSADQARTPELIPLCRKALADIPGVFAITNQASIFQSGLGEGRTITVDISGGSIDELVGVGGAMFGMIRERIEDVQVRPVPSLDLLFPEANFVPDRERLRTVGMNARQFGIGIDVLMDGRDIGDFKQEGEKKIDLVVKASESDIQTPEELYNALMATPAGGSVPVSSLARLEKTTGLTQIRHLERDRTVSLQVTPPYSITIQEAMEIIDSEIVPSLREKGLLDNVEIGMSGTADRLTETRKALQMNFVLAAAIIYLLMAALFGNFIYPFVIMFTIPLASAGGLIGLKLVNTFVAPQQLDILTMLGFVILIGVVVNNAILIVYQSLNNVRNEAMDYKEAIMLATKTRLRPIYMSACTSIFAMLPLVLWPGPGSELYRGLGSVVLGGLAVSTVFTVFLIPPLLMFFIGWEKRPEPVQQELPLTPKPAASGVAK